jgi:acetoin utilization deacetylase AcuC-like enzyme
MRVFYDKRQSVPGNLSFSPSAGKSAHVLENWKRLGIPFSEQSFAPLTADDIALAHDREYVDGVLSCTLMNGHDNRSPEMASALPWVAGSMIAAALHSFISKETSFSPTSGAHHACYASGGDYCTFNFLVIAAIKAHQAGAPRIGILDLDYHYGNGTDDIIERLDLTYIRHYSSGGDWEAKSAYPERWLKRLPGIVKAFADVGLIIYNAGVDSHINDPLGGNLTTEQMARRDRIVFDVAREIAVPICTSLAGGYQVARDGSIDAVLRLHDATFVAAWEMIESPGVKSCDERWTLW